MGFRVGRKIGKYYVSTGKSGTRVSTKIGDYNVSYFSPRGKKKTTKVEDDIGYICTPEEDKATTKQIFWILFLSFAFLFTVWLGAPILETLWVMLVVQAIGSHYIWKHVDTDGKVFYWFMPVIALFISPLAWFWWAFLLITAMLL